MNGNPSTPNTAQAIEDRKTFCGCLPIRWLSKRKSHLSQTELSPMKNGGKTVKTGLKSHQAHNVEQTPPTTPVEPVRISGSADNRSESGSHSVTEPVEESSAHRGHPAQSDPPAILETQSTTHTESTLPLAPTPTLPPAERISDPSSHTPHAEPPPTLVEMAPVVETPILETVAEIMARDRESSAMLLAPTSPSGAPPPYESRADDSHSHVESVQDEFSDPQLNPTLARKEAEKKFREAADKLDELVRKTRPVRESEDFPTPREFTDAAIYTHAKSIKAVMEEFLKQKDISEATRSKSSKFIDKWFQATFTIVKSTLQLLSSVPTPYLVVANGFMCLIEISYNLNRVAKVVDDTVEILYGAIALVQFDLDFSDVIEKEKLDNFLCSILNLSAEVTSCLAECIAVVTRMRDALAGAIKDNADIKSAVAKVHIAMEMYSRSVTTLNAMLSRDAALKKQKDTMMDWILVGRPWEEKHKVCRNRCVEGIGDWVFRTNEFKAWQDDASRILLCDGAAGAGKTYLTSHVIDYLARTLKAPEQCVVYFYFDQNDQVNQTAEFVIKCLLKQLVYQLSGTTELPPAPLKSAFEKFTFGGYKITPGVQEFADIFIACARQCRKPVYVLLDAYNEYEENMTNPLTSRLIQFIQSDVVKVYITSRIQLREIRWPMQPLHLKIQAPAIDVSRYVRAKIQGKNYHPDLEDEIVNAVTRNANGLMLTAHFQVMYLLNFGNIRKLEVAMKKIPVLSEGAFPPGMTDFPTSPQDVYRTVVNKMFAKKEFDDQPLRILSWILHAARPLKMEELQEALAVDENVTELLERHKTAPETIVKSCEDLVDYDKYTRVVKFTHDTVREFLEEHCKDQLFPPQDLAKTCLYYLGLDEFNKPCPDQKALQIRLDKFKFTEYACEHWGFHGRGTPEDEVDIEEVTFRTLETADKLQSVAQINRYVIFGRVDFPRQSILFHSLALNGLSTLCKRLLDKKLQDRGRIQELTYARDDRGWTALHFAAWNGQVSVVELLTDKKYAAPETAETASAPENLVPSSVEVGDSLGYTPLHFAAWNGHLKVVHFLMDKANLEAKNYNAETPLHLAAQWGHLNVVKALARHKANIFAKDQQKSSAIHWAARKGHEEVVEYLITENSKLLTEPGTESRTVLHEAATLGHLTLVKLLIQKNAQLLKMASDDNETALHAAVNQGHLAVVKYLVENNIDVTAQDNDGQTAEALAAKLGKNDIVRFLQGLNESEEIVAHDIKAEEIKAIAFELPEIAQPGPIPAIQTLRGHTVHVAVPRPKRMGYRQAIGRSSAGIRGY